MRYLQPGGGLITKENFLRYRKWQHMQMLKRIEPDHLCDIARAEGVKDVDNKTHDELVMAVAENFMNEFGERQYAALEKKHNEYLEKKKKEADANEKII